MPFFVCFHTILCSRGIISLLLVLNWQKLLKQGILHGNFRLLFGILWSSYIPCSQISLLCDICWRVCSPAVAYDWFPVIFVNREGATRGTGNAHSFRNTWFTDFGEFMISPIHCILENLSVLGLCLRINDSGSLACVSLDCFVLDLFYYSHISPQINVT